MLYLNQCPSCESRNIEFLYKYNQVSYQRDSRIPKEWRHSDWTICWNCALIFAKNRQSEEELNRFYGLFIEYETRSHALTYPPPKSYLNDHYDFGRRIIDSLKEGNLLRQGMSVLYIRSESGALLEQLRQQYGLEELYALEFFDNNIRYMKEVRQLKNVALLPADSSHIPFERQEFDMIVVNHMFTHSFNPKQYLANLKKHLTKDGFMVSVNEQDHMKQLADKNAYFGLINNYHPQLFNKESFANFAHTLNMEATILCDLPKVKFTTPFGSFITVIKKPENPDQTFTITNHTAKQYYDIFMRWRNYNNPRRIIRAGLQKIKHTLLGIDFYTDPRERTTNAR